MYIAMPPTGPGRVLTEPAPPLARLATRWSKIRKFQHSEKGCGSRANYRDQLAEQSDPPDLPPPPTTTTLPHVTTQNEIRRTALNMHEHVSRMCRPGTPIWVSSKVWWSGCPGICGTVSLGGTSNVGHLLSNYAGSSGRTSADCQG